MTKSAHQRQHTLRARIKEFSIPPIHDGLVLGRQSPIGCAAIRKAISLLVSSPFEHIEVDDPVVSDILVRANLLRRLPKEKLVAFVIQQVKPMMEPDEVLHMDVDIEVSMEPQNL
ncbi:MAG: hypothetical protein ACOYXU_09900 [Nitrospirota bacterium]